jgi:hypothetical protein
MPQENTHTATVLRNLNRVLLLLIGFVFFLQSEVIAQEKIEYLQHRYDGTTEIITKDFTRKQLNTLKDKLARGGVIFSFSNLKYNSNNEIIKITLKLKNKKSTYVATWSDKNKPIPSIKTGESYGVVFAIASEFLELKTSIHN